MSKAGRRMIGALTDLVEYLRSGGEWEEAKTPSGVSVFRPKMTIEEIQKERKDVDA